MSGARESLFPKYSVIPECIPSKLHICQYEYMSSWYTHRDSSSGTIYAGWSGLTLALQRAKNVIVNSYQKCVRGSGMGFRVRVP